MSQRTNNLICKVCKEKIEYHNIVNLKDCLGKTCIVLDKCDIVVEDYL